MKTETKRLSYDVGAVAVLAVSVGVAAIVYSLDMIPLDVYHLIAWIFGPLGFYTVVYSLMTKRDSDYYLVWGTVMLAVAVISASYNVVSPVLVLGILIIVLAVIGVLAYMRSRK